MEFSIKGQGNSEYNDVEIHDEPFEVTSSSYKILITPKSKFWRFGIRFATSMDAAFSDTRYTNKDLKHIEVCAGNRPGGDWSNPNMLFLQEYYIHGQGGVLKDWSTYVPLTKVTLDITRKNDSWVLVSCSAHDCPVYSIELPLKEHKFFKSFAWADNLDFEIEGEIIETLRIKLNQIKALTGQEIEIEVKDLMIFFGRNNCGKSSIILGASHHFMIAGNFVMDYIGPNRFETTDTIDPKLKGRRELKEERRKARNTYSQATENNPIDALYEFWLQDDETRKKISNWFALYFDELKVSRREIDEFSSVPEVTIDGRNPRFQGTGARMILGIVVQLFCPDVKFLCIDEPELSLEPRTQKLLFELIKKASLGEDGMPKKQILIATHSHIFLDKENPTNNYRVFKKEGKVEIHQVQNESQLLEAVYNLLGSNPSDLFFPNNIVVVEGRSDKIFLSGVHKLLVKIKAIPDKKIAFHFVEGIEKAKLSTLAITQMLKTQSYIPVYRDKICGLFDAPNNSKAENVIKEIVQYFEDDGTRFFTLKLDAIEYFYPLSAVQEIVSNDKLTVDELIKGTKLFLEQVKGNKLNHTGTYFNQQISKSELASKVVLILSRQDNVANIDTAIIALIKKADELSFK